MSEFQAPNTFPDALPNPTVTDYAAGGWLVTALLGQFGFFIYILVFYAFPAVAGNLEAWNDNVLLNQPPVEEGKYADTFAFGLHALGAGLISVMGGLQLLPLLRHRMPTFHRWNGRLFVLLVVALTLSGYYLTWARGSQPTSTSELGTSVNGLLILTFAALAVPAAIYKRFDDHERWAIRLYLVSNAQWFLRIGGFGYFLIARSLGAEVAFDGWFFQFWVWGCFLVPLAMAELYFRTRYADRPAIRWAGAAVLALGAVLTLFGSFVFTSFTVQLIQGNVAAG